MSLQGIRPGTKLWQVIQLIVIIIIITIIIIIIITIYFENFLTRKSQVRRLPHIKSIHISRKIAHSDCRPSKSTAIVKNMFNVNVNWYFLMEPLERVMQLNRVYFCGIMPDGATESVATHSYHTMLYRNYVCNRVTTTEEVMDYTPDLRESIHVNPTHYKTKYSKGRLMARHWFCLGRNSPKKIRWFGLIKRRKNGWLGLGSEKN